VAAGAKPGNQKPAAIPKDKAAPPQLSELRAVPGKAGHLWFVEAKSDVQPGKTVPDTLWRSTDGGATWTSYTNDGLTSGYSIGFGKECAPGRYPTIFLSGKVNGVVGIYRSTDEGKTWNLIGQDPLGIWGPLKCIDGDKDVFGKVYFAFKAGIGFGYGVTNEKPDSLQGSKQR
jgi:hypothetical protein